MLENSNIENQIILPDSLWDTVYVPSSIEKKRAVMMYFLFGVIIVIWTKKVNMFEYFHLKQSMWWWSCFILVVILSILLMFLPGLKYLWFLWLLFMVIIFVVFLKQARNGIYKLETQKYWLALFSWLVAWVVNLFEIAPSSKDGTMTGNEQ